MDVRFRSLPEFPDPTASWKRKGLGGEQSYTQILERLGKELTHLKARNVVIETGHRAEDIRLDGYVRSSARKPAHPGVRLWFESQAVRGGKAVGYQCHSMDTYREWQDNLRALVLRLEALRAVDRYGGEGSQAGGEQYTGYGKLPPFTPGSEVVPPSAPPKHLKQECAELLLDVAGCLISQTAVEQMLEAGEAAKRIGRMAAGSAHPDRPDQSGDEALFLRVQKARELLGLD